MKKAAGVYSRIVEAKRMKRPLLAVLVDPGKTPENEIIRLAMLSKEFPVDFFFIGGSLADAEQLQNCVSVLKEIQTVPLVIFPGNEMQVDASADALLLLSLISGRNADLLIGKHVNAAQLLAASGLEIIPTGYMLVDSGRLTSVAYMSHTLPVPRDKNDIAESTAMAGELLGMKLIYLEAGSGAELPVPPGMIKAVKNKINIPLIVGGGIDSERKFKAALDAGADLIVVGNVLESRPEMLEIFSEACRSYRNPVSR